MVGKSKHTLLLNWKLKTQQKKLVINMNSMYF